MEPVEIIGQLQQADVFQNLPGPLQTALFLGAMVFIPAGLVCLTGFTRIIIVLSFVRRAVTSQELPPNQVLIGLALFLTWFVMDPTLKELQTKAVGPYLEGTLKGPEAWDTGTAIVKRFMVRQTRKQDLALFLHMSKTEAPENVETTPLRVLVPAFVISELKTAFIMGFCIYLPFLLVDLVVSCVLTSMGMMMMPPVVISAPFKVLLFVLADGWNLVARALGGSFG